MAQLMKTVKNVQLMRAGVEYLLSTGPTTFTPEDLRSVVMAAGEDPCIPAPRLKIGHVDPRFNNPKIFDGSPSFGKASNLRLSDNGMAVYADYMGVPAWLADLLPVAYPSRSIEGHWDVETLSGRKWPFVLSACSLLGVTWPGITVLEDLPAYYGDEIPPDVQVDESLVAAARQYAGLVAASGNLPGGDPMKTSASANLDDIRRAFYSEYASSNAAARSWWICAVLTDPNQLVVEDDEEGQLYLLSFTSDDRGAVSFGDPTPVRVDYVPETRDAQKAAASHVAAALCASHKVLASWPTRAASRPEPVPGGAMDPTEVRNALGLSADASDEQVQEALLQRSGLIPAPSATEPVAPAATPQGDPNAQTPPAPEPAPPTEPTTPPATPPPATPPPATGLNLPPGTVLVDEGTLTAMRGVIDRVQGMEEREAETERTQLIAAAIGEGRIPPSRRDHWLEYLKRDMEGGRAVLASLSPNIVPIHERGHAVIPPNGDTVAASVQLEEETVTSWTHDLFPETRGAVMASGDIPAHNRIAADGRYRRR